MWIVCKMELIQIKWPQESIKRCSCYYLLLSVGVISSILQWIRTFTSVGRIKFTHNWSSIQNIIWNEIFKRYNSHETKQKHKLNYYEINKWKDSLIDPHGKTKYHVIKMIRNISSEHKKLLQLSSISMPESTH
jgi:hypothetical protein